MAGVKGRPSRLELAGVRFGRLTVIARAGRSGRGVIKWLCRCDCGKEKTVAAGNLTGGKVVSCGCYAAEHKSERAKTHGMSNTKEHRAWAGMLQRCKEGGHKRYAGRGIKVCERWASSFEAFFEDMGRCPSPDHTIDRFPDNNGNYEPGNCRWATVTEQNNNKCDSVFLDHEGQRLTVAQWARIKGLSRQLIHLRLKYDWSVSETLDTPAGELPNGVRKPREKYGPREKHGPRPSTIQKMEAAKLLLQEGKSYKEIAVTVRASIASVYSWFGKPRKPAPPEPEYVI